jgi:hypothetical protein
VIPLSITPAVLTAYDMSYPSVAKCVVVSAALSGERRIAAPGNRCAEDSARYRAFAFWKFAV